MDKASQEIFDSILKLSPESLTENQIFFLRARSSYLTSDQKRIFESVLIDKREPIIEELTNKELINLITQKGLADKIPKVYNKEKLVAILK